jgi:hypothetical protein
LGLAGLSAVSADSGIWLYGNRIKKILFGTDYPAFRAGEAIEALKKVQSFCIGTSLPPVTQTVIRGIIEHNSLALLGIDNGVRQAKKNAVATITIKQKGGRS